MSKFTAGLWAFGFGVALMGAVGWVMNLYKLFLLAQTAVPLSQWGLMEVLRLLGIGLLPVGAVVGWL
ncbi:MULTISPECIES: hypothetical protein [unclassified Beijerinckia]|uniref:hypothetical protein n=1 Tax=unclassified Beijerinckia TaxID=2638183 RepID=UPI0008993E72|nr:MULTISPECIES: hypothetical protein [unclassified Beijerinckia]MDH7796393.1 preprotein translocase subunit Sss1 [Beijerinckia sp. GAS462]SEC43246.1 hypothetical protein SAMN05443249_2676 [Beijerinckia sp. 28-YEA-48]